MPAFIKAYVRLMDRIADYIALFAMYLIYLMIGVLLYDVLADKMFNSVQNWTVETAQFTLAAYYFMAGPGTMKDDQHVRLDLLYGRLAGRGRAMVDMVTIWLVVFYLGVMLWGALSSLKYSWTTNQRLPSLWAPSLVPIKLLMVACIILMLLQCLAIFFKSVAIARGKAIL
jgi:TRAP-type mannitol/chloroaromatic compound transport system permease small subunit